MFAALAAHGHTYPLVPLAIAAAQAGHEVVFAGGEALLPSLRAAGLTARPAGLSVQEAFAGIAPGPADERVGRVIGDVMPRRMIADLTPLLAEFRPDAVVYEIATLGASLAAQAHGVPAVGHTFGRMFVNDMSTAMVEAYTALATSLGLEPDSAGLVLDICPPSIQFKDFLERANRLPLRPVPWSECGELVERTSGRPLVYLTLGTAFPTAQVLRTAIDGLAKLPVDVLVSTGKQVDIGEVPEQVRVRRWVSQAGVLPHVDLVVHHGGSGTMLGTFAAGKPQLVLPQGADQFTNAEAIVEAGAGGRILPPELTSEAVTATVRTLLSDLDVRAAASRLAKEIAKMPSPREIAKQLPALIDQG